jgi:hypothetical protein
MKDVGKFLDHLVYLLPFGIFYGHLVYFCGHFGIFSRFGMSNKEKSGNPGVWR